MKKKYTFRKWIALFLSIAMIAASGITTNLHMRAADSTEVEETAKGDAADGTVASGVDSRTAGGEAERGKTEESSQAGGEAAGEAEAGKGGVTAADAGEAAGAAKSGDASAAGEAQGASAASDAEKKEALSEQEQIDQAREGATNTTYSYQDDNITVTAVLDSANAVPDNAKFRVTPITKETAGYNYNAYMDALNDDAAASSDSAAEKQYTGENTLLYDMAFLYEVNVQKEDGSTEQKEVEVQPAEGAVKISVDFKKGQLTDTLDAKSDADVEIKHLPLTDRVKESTDTTAAATDITASDIRVEDVSGADVSVDSQKAEFKADAFSAYAFVQDGSEVTDIKPGTARTAEDVLQDAAYYGITAEKLTQKGHMDSNFAAITYDNGGANFTLGAYTNKKRPGQILAGQVVNELKITTDNPVIVRTPLENEEKIHEGRDKVIVVNTTEEEVGNRVREMLEKVESAGQEMLSEKSYSIEIKDLNDFNNNDHATIDFTKYGSGTFYIDGDSFFSNTSIPYDFKINKNDDQVIVFNFKSETPKFRKFSVNGVQSTTSDASADRYARTILFNMPNATSVSWEGGIFGTVLAPNATVSKFGGTSSGWLVAKDVTVSDGEWHCVYQDMPEYQVETGYSLHAEKLVDHETPEINGFTFSLERKNGDKWEQVAQTVNDGRNVNFSDLQAGFDENRSGIEYITYRISEPQNQTVDGAEYAADGAIAYYAKVAVRNTVRYENNKKIKGAEAEVLGYYSDENCTEKTDTPAFNNTRHKTGSASVTLGGHKNVEGIKNPDKVFRFTLSENGQVIDTKTVTGEGDYRFDPITYTEAGDHTYTVAETAGDAAGYTYDAKTYTVKVHVTDDKNGQLQASISGDTKTGEDLNFTNRYQAKNTSVQFTGRKTLEGRDLKEGEFQFDLKDPDGNILQTVSNGADGTISFKPVEYTKAGTYSYYISEEVPNGTDSTKEAGVTYDAAVYPVTVTVTDDGSGELKAEVSGLNADGSGADFKNTYKAKSASVTLGGHKNVEGIKNSDKVFRFTLSEAGQVIDTKTVTGEGDYRFDPITYTEAGDHTYTVAETAGDAAGYTYDTKTYEVKVSVTDDKNGQLQASISGDTTTGEDLNFTNRYQAENTSVQFTGRKTLEGRDLKEGEFQFDLKDPDGNILQTVSNGADGTISFKPVEYTKAGTYSYYISEEVPNGTDSTKEAGVTYDAAVYPVTVTVTDDGSGELKAEVSGLNADGSGADFKNTYKAKSASVTLGGHKNVEGIKNPDKVFRFTLSENGQVIDTKTVTGEGDYRFDPITYTEAGDHTYTVAETAGDAAGYTYDTKTYEVKVSVTDDKNGQLQASISGDTKTGDDLNFTNRYQAAAASARIGGSKTINGRPDKITAGQFRFELIENDQVIDTATNDTDGNYVFGRISYPTVGTHIYTVIEQNGGSTVNGIKYDAGTKNVTINVTDDGSGTLKANGASDYSTTVDSFNNIRYGSIHVSKSWDDAGNSDQRPSSITVDLIDTETREMVQRAELSADNNWSADFGQLEAGRNYTVHEEPAGEYYTAQNNNQVVTADISGSAVTLVNTFTHPSVNIYANKVLNGGTLTNGEFTFNLYRNSDPGTVVQTAVNNAAGEIFFTGIAYDASGYTVKEAAGTDSSITYDTAAVTYDAEGNITSADHTEFTNTKRPIVLRVQKRSKAAPYDPLEGAAYGLYQVVPGGNDILIESERSDKNGYMYFGKIEPDTLYYFREISAPEGHEVDPYAGVKFQVKYTGSGEIGIFDENGDPTTVGDITSQDGKALLVQHTSEKTAIPGSASLTYSDDRIVAAAEAPEGAFDAGTTMRVTQLSGDDVKDATAIVEAACGKIKNTVAYYNVGFVDAKGNAVEPKTGDVTVTIQYKDSLNMPEGTDVSALRIVHLKQSGGETGVQAVEGTIASASGELLQTSFTTDSFSTFGIVEPSESSSLNSSYLVTAADVADQVSKLKVAKLDTSGKYVKGAKLQIIEKATGTVKAEWNTADGPEEFARWFDDAKTVSMNVDTDYILHEVSAPEGYELADDILFRINRYDSSITICKYDGSGKLVPDQEAIDKWVSDATIQMIDVPVVHSKKTTVKQRVVGNERTIQGSDRVVRVSGAKAVKTGDTAQTELFAILFAAAVGVLLVLVLLRRKHENDK